MDIYTKEELAEALQVVSSTINKCETIQLKFPQGTAQHTLLKNRLKAMYVSKSLLTNENATDKYSTEELVDTLRSITSIISKCEKAHLKFAVGTSHHIRLNNIIKAMCITKSLLTNELNKRG